MSNKLKTSRKRAVQPLPPTYGKLTKHFFGLCVVIAASVSIVAATVKAWEVLHIDVKSLDEKFFFVFVAFCIYIYFGLDTKDKMKKWGLID